MSVPMSKAAVYSDNDFTSEVTGFNVMSVQIVKNSRIISAPVESGQQSFDNKVIDPKKVVVKGVIVIDGDGEYKSAIAELQKMADNRNFEFYSIRDGATEVRNLILQTMPSTREADRFDFLQMELTFVEAMLVQSDTGTPSNSENSDIRTNGSASGMKLATE